MLFKKLAAATVAAGFTLWASAAAAQATIRVANIDALSGPAASIGVGQEQGMRIALDEINAAGGIRSLGGAKLEVVNYDTQSTVQAAQSQAEKAISEGAVAIIGGAQSAPTLTVSTVAERAKIPMIAGTAAAQEITTRGYQYTFRLGVPPSLSTRSVGDDMLYFFKSSNRPLKTLVHVYEDGPFGQSVQAIYSKLAEQYGFKLETMSFKTGSADLSGLASRLKRVEADGMVFTGYTPDCITFTEALRESNISFPYMNLGTSLIEDAYVKAIGWKSMEGFVGYQYFNQHLKPKGNEGGPVKFYDAYRKKYGAEPPFTASFGYTMLRTLAKALNAAGSTDPQKLRDAISKVELTAADGHIMPYSAVKFDSTGQNLNGNIMVVQALKGRFDVITPVDYATAKPLVPVPAWSQKK
jgi:branched-chain amino acid transport system substrate-binding protein